MGLGAGFWSGGGDTSRWMHNWTSTITSLFTGGSFLQMFCSRFRAFQMPFVVGGTGGTQQVDSGYDTGYFYIANSSKTAIHRSMSHTSVGNGGSSSARPQWKQLSGGTVVGPILDGDLHPANGAWTVNAQYQTGFIDDVGATRYLYTGTIEADAAFWVPLKVGTWYAWHYQPWAWYGTVPEVIADILMKCGMDNGLIDQTAFDNAHDAYDLSTGDIPFTTAGHTTAGGTTWFGLNGKHEIGCSRRIGQKAIDLILECARHSRDLYYVNESGQMSVSSYTRPNNSHYGLSIVNAKTYGMIGQVTWTDTLKYLVNISAASWGSGTRVSGDWSAAPVGSDFSASEEPGLESYNGIKLSGTSIETTSVTKFGERFLKGAVRLVNKGGQPRQVEMAHYPFVLDCRANIGLELAHIHYFRISDSLPRKVIKVQTNMVGLDWGIGDKVGNIAVTGDTTVFDTRCIEREYDFDKLTISSVLLEIPPN